MGFYDSVKDDVQDQDDTHRPIQKSDTAAAEDETSNKSSADRETEKDLKQGNEHEDKADNMGNMDELIKQARENEPPDPNEDDSDTQQQDQQQNQGSQQSSQQDPQPQNPSPSQPQSQSQHPAQQNQSPAQNTTPQQQSSQQPQQQQQQNQQPSQQEQQGQQGQQGQQSPGQERREQASDVDKDDIPGWMENQMQQEEGDQAEPTTQEQSAAPGEEAVLHDLKRQNEEIIQHLKGIRTALEQAT